jgi:hypothetical protein
MGGQAQTGEAREPRVRPHWRRRIILVAVAEGIVVVALLLLVGRLLWPEKPRARPLATSATAPDPPDPSPATTPTSPAPILASATPAPPPPVVAAASASASASAAPTPKLPEHVAELDAFFDLPPESASWTPEQRRAYFDQALRKLDDKDRSLTRQLDLARRRGDTETADQLAITLEHFRSRGSEVKAVYAPDAGP